MAFVTSTSKIPTAVTGHALGQFTGTSERFVALNRVNILSVFRISDSLLADSVAHIKDFRLHCTIKYLHAVPIVDPSNRQVLRHILFLLSTKQEVSLVTFSAEDDEFSMITLFYGHIHELYQCQLHLVEHISCSTDGSPVPVLTPFIAFGVNEGDMYFVDVLSAIGSQIQRKRCPQRIRIMKMFPSSLVTLMEERGKFDFFIKRPFHPSEYEVRNLLFGTPTDSGTLPLYALYSDQYDRVHISEYVFHINPPSGKPTHSLAEWISCAGGEQLLVRKGCLQSSVDPTSSQLLLTRDGIVCVGSQLLTFIQQRRRRYTGSIELPFLGSTATEVAAATLLPNGTDVVVCVMTGACAVVHIRGERENEAGVVELPRMELKYLHKDIGTLPSCMVSISSNFCLLSSSLEDTIVVDLLTWNSCTVLENCGPVIDLSVAGDGVTQMVLASTGAERRGGVSILRSVMILNPERILDVPDVVTAFHAVQDLILISSFGNIAATQFKSGRFSDVQIEGPLMAKGSDVVGFYSAGEQYLCVHEYGAIAISWADNSKSSIRRTRELTFDGPVLFAAFNDDILAVAEGNGLTFMKDFDVLWYIPTYSTVSCIALDSPRTCVVGMWDCSVSLLDVVNKNTVGRMVLDAVPHSICCVPTSRSGSTILVGLLNGYLCETSAALIKEQRYRHNFFLMNKPVELCRLHGKNAVICFGPIPMIVLVTNDGCEITGFSVDGVSSCGYLMDGQDTKYLFHSRVQNAVYIGAVDDTQKLNRTFIPLGGTVTIVRNAPEWGGFVVAIRRNNREVIVFLPMATLQTSRNDMSLSLVQQCELLENEQSTFLECVSLRSVSQDGFTNKHDEESIIFVGTGFLFRDEQKARSSRIMWFSQGSKGQLNQLGEKDIKGSLQCCSVVPESCGLVVLAVSGVVFLYQWSARERTFVQREQLSMGLMIFSLIPTHLTNPLDASCSRIVAVDVRHGAFYLEVNRDQGTIKVLSRDECLRQSTTGAVLPNGMVLISDRNDNIFAMTNVEETITPSEPKQEPIKKFKLRVKGQLHVGQCINCMQRGSFAPAAVINEYSQSLRLFRGLMGAQIVYGTAEGGFGTITPVGLSFYFVLRSIEFAMSKIIVSIGGFQPEFFRELLVPGQERGARRIASQLEVTAADDNRFLRCRCVDGDVIEAFLSISHQERVEVLNRASKIALGWYPTLELLHKESEKISDFPTSSDLTVPDPEFVQEKCNEMLSKAELPTLPFTEESVQRLVFDLRRLH